MNYYRLYFLDAGGGIEHAREFEAANDLYALQQAAQWRGPAAMELWSGARKVKDWDPASPVCAPGFGLDVDLTSS